MAKIHTSKRVKSPSIRAEFLLRCAFLTRDKVAKALEIQKQRNDGTKLGQILLEKGLVNEHDLNIALAGQRGMEYVDIDGLEISQEIRDYVPSQMAQNLPRCPYRI